MSRMVILTKGKEIEHVYGLQKIEDMKQDGWVERLSISGFNMQVDYK